MVGAAITAAILLQGAPQGPLPEVATRSRIDPARGVDFHALVLPETVFVGQQATYQLGVFLDQDTRQRIRRNPEFQPPETRSLLSYDLRERATGSLSGTIDGRPYEIHVFRRALFAMTPGRYEIPPARLTYALPQTASFFSREETFSLRAEGVAFVAVEPPATGRPADWAGAVGVWRARAVMDTARGRSGEPFVFTLRVEGQGNVTLLPRPAVSMPWATLVRADERVRVDSAPTVMGGWKEFDWLVTPIEAGVQRVPAVRYAYFNPRARRYEVAMSAPLTVRVAPGDVVAVPERVAPATAEEPLTIRASLGDAAAPPLLPAPAAAVIVLAGPLAAFAVWFARRPRRPRPGPTPRERLEAAAARDDAAALADLRRALVDGIVARTGLDATGLTPPGAWTLALRQAGVSPEPAAAVEALLRALDAACFAGHATPQPRGAGWAAQAREALALVEDEAVPRGRAASLAVPARAMSIAAVVLGMTLGATPTGAQPSAHDAFAQGATAYAGGDYLRAARHFADAAHAMPSSAAAWANFGTTSFLAADTSGAALGWQRALRLAPLDGELRARLARLRAPQESGPAGVPPVPGRVALGLAALLWTVGWAITARQCWRRRPALRVASATLLVGGAALWAAWRVARQLQGTDLVVVMAPAALHTLPALGADTRATPVRGEVATVIARRGVWAHIRLDGRREGWIPAERVASLARD